MSRTIILLISLILISGCSREMSTHFPTYKRVKIQGVFQQVPGHLIPEERASLAGEIGKQDRKNIRCTIEYGTYLYVFTGEHEGTLYKCVPAGLDSYQIVSSSKWSSDPLTAKLSSN